jgi:hypothetical protein
VWGGGGARVTSESMVVAAAPRSSITSGLLAPVYFDFSRGEWPLAGMLSASLPLTRGSYVIFGGHSARPQSVRGNAKPGAYLGQICVAADGPVTLRRPAGGGPKRIFGHNGRKRSLSVRFRHPVGDALRPSPTDGRISDVHNVRLCPFASARGHHAAQGDRLRRGYPKRCRRIFLPETASRLLMAV